MRHSGGGWIIIHSVLYVLLCVGLWASHFFISFASPLLPSDLVINRVQITGGTGKTDNDFISFYNKSNSVIDLSGLRLVKRTKTGTTDTTIKSWVDPFFLNPGTIYTWANSSDGFAESINADTSSAQTISNDNGIALRQGSENTGIIIDSVGWGTAQNIFVETLPFAQNPGANEILERINNHDSNNNSLDFRITTSILPSVCGNQIIETGETCDDGNIISGDGCDTGCRLEIAPSMCGNHTIENGEQCDDGNITSNDGCSSSCQIEATETGEIYINEFVSDPVSGSNEWIELFSPSVSIINITDWSIEDGAGSKTRLSGSIGGTNKFLVIEKPTGSLNNAGDKIILRNKTGIVIDQVTYGDWDDGNINDNAPMASDPFSIARLVDTVMTGNDLLDYALTTTITKGLTNVITAPINEEEVVDGQYDVSKTITISEIFPDPEGIDAEVSQGEFIELYNFGETSVNLTGWYLDINDTQYIYDFAKETIIESKKYLLVSRSTYFKLSNDSGKIKLFQPSKSTAYQTVSYKDGIEGQSFSLVKENIANSKIWKWTSLPTPLKSNIHVSPPLALFSSLTTNLVSSSMQFDSSDSHTGGTPTTYSWNFGDNTMSLVSNPQHTYTSAGTFTIVLTLTNQYGSSTISKKIKITNEPESQDNSKVVAALMNTSEQEKNPNITSIILNEIFPNPPGKDEGQEWVEVFNMSDETVNLKNWRIANKSKKGPIINEDIILKPKTLAIIPAIFLPTLGNSQETVKLLNQSEVLVDQVSYETAPESQSYSFNNGQWQWTKLFTPGKENISLGAIFSSGTEGIKENPLDPNQKTITGTVIVLPGILSTQYFYIKPTGSEILFQIYSSKKLFPELKIGQEISVTGEISSIESGQRLKISASTDIQVKGEGTMAEPPISNSVEINKPPYPRLVRIEGEVTSKKSPRLVVTDSSGDIEVYLVKGSNLSITRFALGDKLNVTGIVEMSGNIVRVVPRSESDIKFLNAESGPDNTISSKQISNELSTAQRNNKKNLFLYLIIGGIGLVGIAGFLFWKYGQKK